MKFLILLLVTLAVVATIEARPYSRRARHHDSYYDDDNDRYPGEYYRDHGDHYGRYNGRHHHRRPYLRYNRDPNVRYLSGPNDEDVDQMVQDSNDGYNEDDRPLRDSNDDDDDRPALRDSVDEYRPEPDVILRASNDEYNDDEPNRQLRDEYPYQDFNLKEANDDHHDDEHNRPVPVRDVILTDSNGDHHDDEHHEKPKKEVDVILSKSYDGDDADDDDDRHPPVPNPIRNYRSFDDYDDQDDYYRPPVRRQKRNFGKRRRYQGDYHGDGHYRHYGRPYARQHADHEIKYLSGESPDDDVDKYSKEANDQDGQDPADNILRISSDGFIEEPNYRYQVKKRKTFYNKRQYKYHYKYNTKYSHKHHYKTHYIKHTGDPTVRYLSGPYDGDDRASYIHEPRERYLLRPEPDVYLHAPSDEYDEDRMQTGPDPISYSDRYYDP